MLKNKKLFRSILKSDYIEEKKYHSHKTKRAPSNVPYLIDNVWEYLRPQHLPSRRFAIYASPNYQSALDSASSGRKPDEYMVCEIIMPDNVKVAHLGVVDAKYHPDIKILQKAIMSYLNFNDLTIYEKMEYASLFLPCVEPSELKLNEKVVKLLNHVAHLSTFWQDANTYIDPDGLGELFFELEPNQSYTLKKI